MWKPSSVRSALALPGRYGWRDVPPVTGGGATGYSGGGMVHGSRGQFFGGPFARSPAPYQAQTNSLDANEVGPFARSPTPYQSMPADTGPFARSSTPYQAMPSQPIYDQGATGVQDQSSWHPDFVPPWMSGQGSGAGFHFAQGGRVRPMVKVGNRYFPPADPEELDPLTLRGWGSNAGAGQA